MALLPVNPSQPINPYRSNSSVEPTFCDPRSRLHEWLNYDEIEALGVIFKNSVRFDYNQFRKLLWDFNIYLTNEDYDALFNKMNINRDAYIDWDEFVSFLIWKFQEDDPSNQKEKLVAPISQDPSVKKSRNRHPIVCIKRIFTVLPDKSIKSKTGGYVTVSKDGTVHFWTNDFEIQRSGKSSNRESYLRN